MKKDHPFVFPTTIVNGSRRSGIQQTTGKG